MENTVIESEPGAGHHVPGHGKPYDPRGSADVQESMKAKVVGIRRKLVEQVSGAAPPAPRPSLRVRGASKSLEGGRGGWAEAPRGGAREPPEHEPLSFRWNGKNHSGTGMSKFQNVTLESPHCHILEEEQSRA